MAIVRIEHGRQTVKDTDGSSFEAYVTTFECDQCKLHLGSLATDVALARLGGNGGWAASHAETARKLEEEHKC